MAGGGAGGEAAFCKVTGAPASPEPRVSPISIRASTGALKSTKHPNSTISPRRAGTRPASIPKATQVTAITASAVPKLPSSTPSTHCAAASSALPDGGAGPKD